MNNELKHYGVLGMKWGVRRYQNKDGSLTPAGKKRAKERIENINQKIKKGSLHSIVGLALEDQGYKKAAQRQYQKSDFKIDNLEKLMEKYKKILYSNDGKALVRELNKERISKGKLVMTGILAGAIGGLSYKTFAKKFL
jgi:hypothetical protein